MARLEYVSDHLKEVTRAVKECRHGGLYMDGENLESFIARLQQLTGMAVDLENALSRETWNRRAAGDASMKAKREAAVLAAMQIPGTNIRLFPVVPRPRPQPGRNGGGDAA